VSAEGDMIKPQLSAWRCIQVYYRNEDDLNTQGIQQRADSRESVKNKRELLPS
jgi:hypothetical protein